MVEDEKIIELFFNRSEDAIRELVRNISLKLYSRKNAAKRNSAYECAMEELEAYLPAPDNVETEIEAKEQF